ncbi:MAG: DUF3971 domain-containing protein, partial [Gammaproteobacteria bacterium]|nr:DUF3971 domain-containing protein [Gammaproteobacteria bacterium]
LQLSRLTFGGSLRGEMPHYLQFQERDNGWHINIDRLNMSALPPLLKVVKPELLAKESKFSGELRAIELFYGTGVELFKSELDNIQLVGIDGWPAFTGLVGHAEWSNQIATVDLNSPKLELQIPRLFENTLPSLTVVGKLSAEWDSERWQLWGEQLQITNDDLNLQLSTNIQSRLNEKPHVAVTANIDVAEVKRLKHYVPGNLLTEGASSWLRGAFHNGTLKDGKLLLYGRGAAIADRSKGGRLEIALEPKGVDLQFHQKWPQIKGLDADLRFSGRQMVIRSNQGEVLSSGRVDEVVVKVDNFKSALLEVDGVAHFDAQDGVRYISLSPLKDILGDVGETIKATGKQRLKLHLGIPLGRKLVKSGSKIKVGASLEFQDVALDIDEQLKINKIGGLLAFNQSGVERSVLGAELFQRPLKLSVYKRKRGVQESTFITTSGLIESQKILSEITLPWARQVTGSSNWNAALEFNHSKKSAVLNLKSNLNGVQSRLPHPVNKNSGEALSLKMAYHFKGKSRKQIDLTLGERLSAQLKLPEKGGALRDIHIHLGSEPLKSSTHKGLLFTGQLSKLDVDEWLQLVPQQSRLTQRGGFDQPIQINMKRLHILEKDESTKQGDKVKRGLKPASIPPLTVEVNALKYGTLQLGGIVLVTKPSKKGLLVSKLVVSDGNHRLTANGSWKQTSGTELKVKVVAKDLGKMLKGLQFDTPMQEGELTVNGNLRWPKSPFDFELKRVNGNLNVNVKNGFIADVGSDAGQLLELLNVRKVLNRIFLDFSDLKDKKGLSYKEISGNFRISKGNLHTSDFKLSSVPATMQLTGRTGLVNQDYDHHLSIVPKISDAVPVAGTLVFGPQVAVALLAFRKLLGKDFDKASMQQYRITGSWDDPNIKKIEPKKIEINNE